MLKQKAMPALRQIRSPMRPHDIANLWTKLRPAVLVLSAVTLSGAVVLNSAAHAQNFIRTPNLNIGPRVPTVGATVAPRVNPNIGGRDVARIGNGAALRTPSPHLTARMAVKPQLPFARYSPNLYPACSSAYRDSDGECQSEPVVTADGGGKGSAAKRSKNGGSRRDPMPTMANRTIAGELVAEIDAALTDVQADELARRHGLRRIDSQNFPLIGATIGLFRVADRRPVETVSREFATEASVRSVQPNFRYLLQDQKGALVEGDPAQYALAKLKLPEAHRLAHGADVRVAVIDSAIDARHPELANSIAETFDAASGSDGPHVHGTGIAGAITAHARLMGGAPAARILAIRAFVVASNGVQSSSFVVLKGLDYAAVHGAQIINMSFAGPKDALIERAIGELAAKGIVMVAAAGNAGAKSPPLYPAANPNVIAVSATDAQDHLFAASNRGGHIAVAAPGVDIFLPAPDQKYQVTSGTSFSAAYVSALAALMLEHNPALKPEAVRAMLMKTARDLGSPGRDDLFGAGEADAYAAVLAAGSEPAVPVAGSAPSKAAESAETPPARALNLPAATIASDKPDSGDNAQPARP
jgi:subtilisin family serine protease